jgi:tetratricopeptide (TPR) repeat protein
MAEDDPGEFFFSQYMMARLKIHFHANYDEIVGDFKEAIRRNPTRAEPLYYLADYYLEQGKPELAYEILSKCPNEFHPDDIFYTEAEIYNWRLDFLKVKVCYALQKYSEMREATKRVLAGKEVPEDVREESHKNLIVLNGMLAHEP